MRQAREYFKNAETSDLSVRPLLTFYGIACLGRTLLLLMKKNGGEETIAPAHGLEAVGWSEVMSGDLSKSLKDLGNLTVRIRRGLFSEFLIRSKNTTLRHWRSSDVTGLLRYNQPKRDFETRLQDLFSRCPDLQSVYTEVGEPNCEYVTKFASNDATGLRVTLVGASAAKVAQEYGAIGYQVTSTNDSSFVVSCSSDILVKEPPIFVHTNRRKMADAVPYLMLASPFPNGGRISEMGIAYMISYVLGMLVRYFPTHWIALIHGRKGDELWPIVSQAQRFVETAFPELVAEYVDYVRDHPPNASRP